MRRRTVSQSQPTDEWPQGVNPGKFRSERMVSGLPKADLRSAWWV